MTKKQRLKVWNKEKESCNEIGYYECDKCKRKKLRYILTVNDGNEIICRNCCLKYLSGESDD